MFNIASIAPCPFKIWVFAIHSSNPNMLLFELTKKPVSYGWNHKYRNHNIAATANSTTTATCTQPENATPVGKTPAVLLL